MAHDLGMGGSPGIDLPGAATGHIGDRKNTKLDWEQIKGNYCKGAKNPTFSAHPPGGRRGVLQVRVHLRAG